MATYYWVGGSGSWDATTTTNWASSSGGAGGAGVPTSLDDVIFDAGSNTGTDPFTVTVTGTSSAPAVCKDFSTGGAGGALDGAMTLLASVATSTLEIYGSLSLPATNFVASAYTGVVIFKATTTGKTITTNGVTFVSGSITFDGVGGEWTLGSAFTGATAGTMTITNGSFATNNFNLTTNFISSNNSNVRSISLGSSTVTLSRTTTAWNTTDSTNLTFNAGTSSIVISAASTALLASGQTFYNVSFTSAALGTTTITGANTFNNLSQTSRSATGIRNISLGANQTVSGTLTLGAANTAIRRMTVASDTIGTQRTITLNGTLATLADVDFRDIATAGTVGTWTGTRIGNGLNNSGITFDAPKTVYWNLSGSQNWSATGWATTNNGTPAVNNFPLAQDTATFTEAGAAGTVTFDAGWWIGNLQMADGISNRTTAFTLATAAQNPQIFKNITLFSNLTLSGTGIIFLYSQGTTQTITSAGITFTQSITINSPSGTVQLLDNLTLGSTLTTTLTAGTLDLNNLTLSTGRFSSSNTNTRSVSFGTGNITCTDGAATVWNTLNLTNFSYTGTPDVNFSYSGGTGTRTIAPGTTNAVESNVLNFNITAGTDLILMSSASRVKNLNFTGFSGALTTSFNVVYYGDLTFSSTMTAPSMGSSWQASGSVVQNITTAGITIDLPLIFNNVGGGVVFQDALTQGSTRNFRIDGGTVQLKDGVTSTVGVFATSGTNQKFLQSTTPGSQATLSQASGTVDASYLTIRDINAVGGATWNAYVNQQNVDAGNNDGWDFGISPIVGSYEYTYQLRSFTQPRRF
jgi:hypothetical protein